MIWPTPTGEEAINADSQRKLSLRRDTTSAQPALTAFCHCRSRKNAGGGGYSVNVAIAAESLEIQGAPQTYRGVGASGLPVERRFCPPCGSALFTAAAAFKGLTFGKGGSLDDASWIEPTLHIWCDSAQPWDKLPQGATCVPKNPPASQLRGKFVVKANPRSFRALLVGALAGLALASASPGLCQSLTPRADHHQHLQSAYGVELANRTLPPTAVPADVTRLLRKREERWNQSAALQELFTQSSQVFTGGSPGWAQGPRRGAEFLSRRFARPYALTPTASQLDERTGWISGYYTRGEGASTARLGYFHLALEKAADGEWRISSEVPSFPGPPVARGEDARQLVRYLDEAGIRFGVVLSEAYFFDSPRNDVADRLDKVRAENDWTADQVAGFKDRLIAFCSFNPLADHSLAELERCAASGRFAGIKLHFGMSGVDLKDSAHVAKVRAVVEAANRRGMSLIVHVRAGPDYGKQEARVLLDRIVSAAPDVVFQIAHLWGGEQFSADALAEYANAVSRGEPSTRRLYFDLAEVALVVRGNERDRGMVVLLMRQIGFDRILYATDGPVEESQSPVDGWKETQRLPLTKAELAAIARNVAPYLRGLVARSPPSKNSRDTRRASRSARSEARSPS